MKRYFDTLPQLKRLSPGEEALAMQLKAHGIEFEREFRFAPPRRWRFDFAIPQHRLAIEVEGGVWGKKSRHTTATGYTADLNKYNNAIFHDWRVLRYTTDMVRSGQAIDEIGRLLDINA